MYLYLDHKTWVHRLHPLVRLLGMIAVFVAAFAVERPLWQLPIIGALAVLLVWTGSLPNPAATVT
jgi:energy-coupling factor transporter transmembrane protein EcfT